MLNEEEAKHKLAISREIANAIAKVYEEHDEYVLTKDKEGDWEVAHKNHPSCKRCIAYCVLQDLMFLENRLL